MTDCDILAPYIPLILLAGFIIAGIFGRVLNRRIAVIAVATAAAAFALSLYIFIRYLSLGADAPVLRVELFQWIAVKGFTAPIAFRIDALSLLMMLIITGIGGVIHVFSLGYMEKEAGYSRFFAYLNLFTAAMLILVMADNILLMFLGWEGVGLCSYLLIGHYYDRDYAARAANKAFIVNRVGDAGFLIGIFLIFTQFNSLEFSAIQSASAANPFMITVIAFCLFLGAAGKSAQLPLHVWLPDAMAGPTPVSALIHAATMVTAGIYLIARLNFIFVLAPIAMTAIAIIGALTALFAATIAANQTDIKKVLAYSTISQLGFMMAAMGVGAFSAGLGHLMTHAFFKALLFLAAGSVITMLHHQQDIRAMGGLKRYLPITFGTFLIGTLAISGIPGFSGFFSKDEIVYTALASSMGNPFVYVLLLITSGLTAFYMFRLLFVTFFGEPREYAAHGPVKETPAVMWVPLTILAFGAVVAGYFTLPRIFGPNTLEEFLHGVVVNVPISAHFEESESITGLAGLIMIVTLAAAAAGFFAAYYRYIVRRVLPMGEKRVRGIIRIAAAKYYVDELYAAVIVRPLSAIGSFFHVIIDNVLFTGTVTGIAHLWRTIGRRLRHSNKGILTDYLISFAASTVIIAAVFVFVVLRTTR
ncbi:MAG: NADH-quinone oxidoreductase subunit L [Spirochaetota bacterium]